jgi:hypothetical protein
MSVLGQCIIVIVVGLIVVIAAHLYTRPEVSSSEHRS